LGFSKGWARAQKWKTPFTLLSVVLTPSISRWATSSRSPIPHQPSPLLIAKGIQEKINTEIKIVCTRKYTFLNKQYKKCGLTVKGSL